MMEKITTDQNEIISSVQKLSPQYGDILMFYMKTDDYGMPLMDLDVVKQTAEMINNILESNGAAGLFLLDKFFLFSIDDANTVIKRLENYISYIREAVDQTPNIENGIFENPVKIQLEKAQDQFKRVL